MWNKFQKAFHSQLKQTKRKQKRTTNWVYNYREKRGGFLSLTIHGTIAYYWNRVIIERG